MQNQNQRCLGCNATSTPEWRRGPMGKKEMGFLPPPPSSSVDSFTYFLLGPRTLCNACGLVYAKMASLLSLTIL